MLDEPRGQAGVMLAIEPEDPRLQGEDVGEPDEERQQADQRHERELAAQAGSATNSGPARGPGAAGSRKVATGLHRAPADRAPVRTKR